jgi:hypothetical protein
MSSLRGMARKEFAFDAGTIRPIDSELSLWVAGGGAASGQRCGQADGEHTGADR